MSSDNTSVPFPISFATSNASVNLTQVTGAHSSSNIGVQTIASSHFTVTVYDAERRYGPLKWIAVGY